MIIRLFLNLTHTHLILILHEKFLGFSFKPFNFLSLGKEIINSRTLKYRDKLCCILVKHLIILISGG